MDFISLPDFDWFIYLECQIEKDSEANPEPSKEGYHTW